MNLINRSTEEWIESEARLRALFDAAMDAVIS